MKPGTLWLSLEVRTCASTQILRPREAGSTLLGLSLGLLAGSLSLFSASVCLQPVPPAVFGAPFSLIQPHLPLSPAACSSSAAGQETLSLVRVSLFSFLPFLRRKPAAFIRSWRHRDPALCCAGGTALAAATSHDRQRQGGGRGWGSLRTARLRSFVSVSRCRGSVGTDGCLAEPF